MDIDRLTEAELIDLNHRIVERLRLLQHIRAHADMLEFKIGERVAFQPDGRGPVHGMLGSWPILMIGAGSPNRGHEPSLAPFAGPDLRSARNLEPRSRSLRDYPHPSGLPGHGALPALRQAVQALP